MTKNEFSENVIKYMLQGQALQDARAEMIETKKALKQYLESENLSGLPIDDGRYTVRLVEITREMIPTSDNVVSVTTTNMGKYVDKMVKPVLPEKYTDVMVIPKTPVK